MVRQWKTHNGIMQGELTWPARPKPFFEFTWDATWTAGTIKYFNPFSSRFLAPATVCKLRGRTYFNSNLTIRMLVNGMAFHCGRLGVAWIARNRIGDFHVNRKPTLTYMSQLPIQATTDAVAQNTIEIKIPFLQQEAELFFENELPEDEYVQSNDQNCIGFIAIYALTDFYTASATNGFANATCWAMVDDISLSDVYRSKELNLKDIPMPTTLADRLDLPRRTQEAPIQRGSGRQMCWPRSTYPFPLPRPRICASKVSLEIFLQA